MPNAPETHPKVIKLPKGPGWPGPDPENPWPISWDSFEMLVSTVIDYHAAQPDGMLKDEVTEIVQKIAS